MNILTHNMEWWIFFNLFNSAAITALEERIGRLEQRDALRDASASWQQPLEERSAGP